MAAHDRRVPKMSPFVIFCLHMVMVFGKEIPKVQDPQNGFQPIVPQMDANVNMQMMKDTLNKKMPLLGGGQMGQGGQQGQGGQLGQALKPKGPKTIMLAEREECQEDIHRICSMKTAKKHNFAIIDCLQSDLELEKQISEQCQHLVWEYKHNMTRDDRFETAGKEVCQKELNEISECKAQPVGSGKRIPCLIEYLDNITDPGCHQFLTKMAKIVFSDYMLVYNFMESCQEDIRKLGCGRLDSDKEKMHGQGKTIICLASKISQLVPQCKKQVLRVAELQSDDYHLDRPLYYACRDARETFCEDVHAGNGKVFECLFKNKNKPSMPAECQKLLTLRQQLMAEDVKVEKTFYMACKVDIRVQHCVTDNKDDTSELSRSRILLCLENALKRDQRLSGQCVAEMNQLRRMLMEDFRITPEIVTKCDIEINQFCGAILEGEGRTLHCLMQNSNPLKQERNRKTEFRSQCKAALESLLQEADVASDFSIDRVLAEACAPVLTTECKNIDGSRVINCLMEKVDSDHMTDDCEERLMEIQYFIVRDFKLDPDLYKACHKEAVSMCHADENWFKGDIPSASNSPMVFPCLYRNMKDDKSKLSRQCAMQVKRVMRKRAKRIELEPELEEACLSDLGMFCSDLEHYGKGKEFACLQDNLDNLVPDCQDAISDFTEDEDEDLDLDTILMKACTPMIKKFCGDLLEHDAEAAEVMNCLIEHKHHQGMNTQCAAGVEHHQIVQLKDIRFTHAFKEACKGDVEQHCQDMKKKSDIVVCLSEIVREDVLKDEKHRIKHKCRQQLRVEVLHRGESIELDPQLKKGCTEDIKNFCAGVHTGNAAVIECLRGHQKELSNQCHVILFKREQVEAVEGADFVLFRECKSMIKMFCMEKDANDILDCLKMHQSRDNFDTGCRKVVMRRALQETKDIRLNPSLAKSCRLDIPKFCSEVMKEQTEAHEMEGKVINCLKIQFIKKRLSRDCFMEIKLLVKETHKDINMDPVLMHACQTQIRQYCGDAMADHEPSGSLQFRPSDEGDKVVECLEQKLMEGKIEQTSQCAREVSRIVEEAHVDVHIDSLLYTACIEDLSRFCQDVETGEGKKMSCLLSILEDYPDKLKPKCNRLLAQRKTLWEFAAKSAPAESLSDLSQQVLQSPAKSYLLGVLMTIIGLIFIVGITCGRVTKRVTAEMKNK